jgi:hypothetical protein
MFYMGSIPCCHNEEDFTFNEHDSADYDDSQPSTSASNIQDRESSQTIQQNEPMTELEI